MVFFYDIEAYKNPTSSAPSISLYPANWLSFVKETKCLYLKNNYKRCASQCERMLQDQSEKVGGFSVELMTSSLNFGSYNLCMKRFYTST